MTKKTYVMGLCQGRHAAPVKEGIFPRTVNTFDPEMLYKEANDRMPEDCGRLALYVTGLTVAIMAVVRVCQERKIDLICYHYQGMRNTYDRQDVLQW